jgi:hypothetical protein
MKLLLILLLITSAQAILFTCEFRANNSYSLIGEVYTCHVMSIDFSDETELASYTGSHHQEKSNNDVKMLSIGFYGGKVDQPPSALPLIPKETSKTFPNLIGVNFKDFNILPLTGDELKDFPDFEWILIMDTNLERIPGNLFAENRYVKLMNFENNKIKRVGDGLLDKLYTPKVIKFLNNVCIHKRWSTPDLISDIKEVLKDQCPDVD